MLRAFRVAGFAIAATLLMSAPALADPSIAPGGPVPGAPDPNVPRLWSLWESDGTAWLATAATDVPDDGSVIGWRFSASPDGTATEPPGGEMPAFEAVCGKEPAASGHKRVVITVDFGDADSDAYPGDQPPSPTLLKCVNGAENATATQLLALAAKARVDDKGAPLAINDYPSKEKGGTPLADAPVQQEAAGGGLPLGWILGGAGALVLLAGGAFVATRRRTKVTS